MHGLHFPITTDNKGFMSGLTEVVAGVKSASQQIQAEGLSIETVFNRIKQGVTILGIGTGLKELTGQIFTIRDEFQKLEITFNTLLGSKEKSDMLMSQLIKTAAITPFDMRSVTEGAKSLLAYGVAAEDVNKTLIGLGDIAAGLKIPLTDLTYLYGTTIVQGRMFTQDLRQFQGRGIPIAEELANVLGKPKEKIGELVTAGQVTSDVFIKAMQNMTAEGSKFGGLMEAQSKSLGGQWENIKDSIEQMFNEIGKSSEGLFNKVLSATGTSLEFIQKHIDEIGAAISTAIAAVGINKAAQMTVAAIDTAKNNYAYEAEISGLQNLLPLKEKETQTDLELAVAEGRLTKERAAHIESLRKDVQERLKLLESQESEAASILGSASEDVDTLSDWKNELDKQIESTKEAISFQQELYERFGYTSNAEEVNTLTTKLNTLEEERNSVANELQAATEKKQAAATNLSTISKERETVATGLNTAHTNANTAATNLLTLAKNACKTAAQKLWAVISANPIGATIAALGVLYMAIDKYCGINGQAAEASEKFGESTAKQIIRLNTLCDILNGTSTQTKTYKSALDELNEQLKQNGIEQIKEGNNLDEINSKRQKAIELIKAEAIERNRANDIQSIDDTYSKSLSEAKTKLEEALSVAWTDKREGGFFADILVTTENQIREKAPALASMISQVIESNIDSLKGKQGQEYQDALGKIFDEITSRMVAMGIDADVANKSIHSFWANFYKGDDAISKYIESVKEATESHDTNRKAIDDDAQALRDAETAHLSYSEKVESTRKKLEDCSGDVDTLYSNIQNLMAKYKDNTIGFTIQFNSQNPPAWMSQISDEDIKRLATRFTSLGEGLKAGQRLRMGDKVFSKQELLQRGADYAQEAKNRADKKKERDGRWDAIDAEIKDAKQEVHKYKSDSAEAKALYAKIDKLEKEKKGLGDYDRDHKKSSGQSADQIISKKASEHQKLLDLIKGQEEERLRLEQEYEYQRWQSRINLMEEGEEKVLEQMKLDQSKERSSLKEQMKSAIDAEIQRQKAIFDAQEEEKAAGNKKYAKKVFNPESIYNPDKGIIDLKIQTIIDRYSELNKDLTALQKKAERDRVKENRLALAAYLKEYGDYEQQRLATTEEYNAKIAEAKNEGERLALQRQKESALALLDYDHLKKDGAFGRAMGELMGLSRSAISSMITDMEKHRDVAIKTFDADKVKEYSDAITKLREAYAGLDNLNIDSNVAPKLKQRIELTAQLSTAQTERDAVQKQIFDLQARQDSMDPTEFATKMAALKDMLKEADNKVASLKRQLSALSKVELPDITGFAKNVSSVLNVSADLASVWDDDLSDGISKAAKTLDSVINAVETVASSITVLTANIGGGIANMVSAVSAGTTAAVGTATGALKTIEMASAILAIISAAIQVATVVANLLSSDKKHEKKIEGYQRLIDKLDRSYKKLEKSMQQVFSFDASEVAAQQEKILERQQALLRLQLEEEKAKKKRNADAIAQYEAKLSDISDQLADLKTKTEDAVFGKEIKSQIEDFAQAYADAWDKGESRAVNAKDVVREMMRDMVRESIKAAIQSSGSMKKIRDTLISFYRDGILSVTEQNEIYTMADDLQRELDSRFGAQRDLLSGESFSQSTSVKTWQGMTSEDAGVLQGRFAALAATGENIRGINQGIADSVKGYLIFAEDLNRLSQESLNVQITSMGHLETISKHTRELAAMRETLEKIEKNVRDY